MDPDKIGYSRLPEKIKAVRVERRMTQAALSEGIVTRNMLSRIENGAALPSLPVLCALADRLGMPVGFFIDDHDDGSDARNRRLLDMALEEYAAEHFESSLHFCQCLEDFTEIRDALSLSCRYRIALDNMYAGRLTAALRGFSDCAREAKQGVIPFEKCVLYRALLSGFLSNTNSGEEEEVLIALRGSVKAPDDLVTLATVLYLLKEKKPADAAKYLSVSLFSEIPYRTLSEAAVALAERDYSLARKHLFETLGYRLPLPIECYCLTMLEKCAAAEKDFESAYSFLSRRRERLSEMT